LAIDSISKDAGDAWGYIAPSYLYTKQFAKAEFAAKKALQLNPSVLFPNLSLARAYLFQGKYEQAKEIYLKMKNEKMDKTETGGQASLRQLKAMDEAGVIPPEYMEDVAKIRKLMQEE